MKRLLKIAAVLIGLAPAAASAQQWGAVCIGPGGAWGYAHSYGSESGAYNRALQESQYDCEEVRTFFNTCAAMAVASNGGWGWSTGNSRGQAEAGAMSYCRQYGSGCQVRVWACSG
ncbi:MULTISPECIES: DUF4189 domain-containing protein [Maritimibacter]|jgi:hypothetical protein|uniref:DUF4189 domain-containing protein n=1 Tax=Maritimibacter TaxID=404235 RepID=UPI0003232358|nr:MULTISPECIES: DUF4189 domain-containing protein [Maritimibacter]MBL6427554.1 DUF4189 domain-containing protein [Maritimibacter sp.]TYP84460.1 uncharacterized protein DUF4189 [Maritimibacter alkaliphilus HTCC2654]